MFHNCICNSGFRGGISRCTKEVLKEQSGDGVISSSRGPFKRQELAALFPRREMILVTRHA